jgi:spermidine synthase
VLCLYLLGTGVGSLAGARLAKRLGDPLRAFLTAQCLLLLFAGLGPCLLAWLPPATPVLSWYLQYWAGEIPAVALGTSEDLGGLLRLYLGLPLALFGIPTFLMGLSFPLLQRAVQDDVDAASRRVGLLQAANIAGCLAGSLLVGLLSLDLLGTTGSFRALLLVGALVFAGVGAQRYGFRTRFLALGLGLVLLACVFPGQGRFWLRLHGAEPGLAPALLAEDATGVGAIVPGGERLAVMINGRYHSWLPFGGIHTKIGAIPVIVHPAPLEVAVIGLASGDTPRATGLRGETQSITLFEIFRPQWRLLEEAAARDWPGVAPLEPLRAFLADPRVRLRVADGRKALESGSARYDVIEADALWPESAWSGNLYSLEFFSMVAQRLKPLGIMCSWAPTPRIRRTFRQAFPHVVCVEGGVCLGSNQPLAIDLPTWHERLFAPSSVAYLGGTEAASSVWEALATAHTRLRPPRADFNRDLDPRDEFLVSDRSLEHSGEP